MIQVPMSPAEFAEIETGLKAADPGEVSLIPGKVPEVGDIKGTHPISWSATYTYTGSNLHISGHGIFARKVESTIQDKLTAALASMRNQPKAAAQ
jgi:hypothetical protein